MAIGQHGWTATFATSAITLELTNVSGIRKTRSGIETTHHGTTDQRTNIFETLDTLSPVTLTFNFDPLEDEISNGAAELITFTAPLSGATGTAGFYAGTGAIVENGPGDGEAGSTDVQSLEVVVQFDGGEASGTPLTWTKEVPV